MPDLLLCANLAGLACVRMSELRGAARGEHHDFSSILVSNAKALSMTVGRFAGESQAMYFVAI